MASPLPNYVPLTADQVHRMLGAGILREGEPVELVEGLLVRKDRRDAGGDIMTHGTRHRSAIALLLELAPRFRKLGCWLQAQSPIALSETSEPEPDVAVVAGGPRDYFGRHPTARDILVVVEVADSSLAFDRGVKLALYAASAIPVYVIVDLKSDQLQVHEEPDPASKRYLRRRDHAAGETVPLRLGTFGVLDVPVSEVIPPRIW